MHQHVALGGPRHRAPQQLVVAMPGRRVFLHQRTQQGQHPLVIEGLAGLVQARQALGQHRPWHFMFVGTHDQWMRRAFHVVADQQFLIEFLTRPQADHFDCNISVRMLFIAQLQAAQMHHAPCEIEYFNRLTHVQHINFAALAHRTRLNHQLRRLGDGHEIARDVGMGQRDRPTRRDLLAEQRHDRT